MQAALEANAERRERELEHLRAALDGERTTVSALQDSVAELRAARERLDDEPG
jgi:hypothetical protein